jgi:hypothetical protein
MDYSSLHFGKSLAELTYTDITDYFQTPRTESAVIEFKSFSERSAFDAGLQKVVRGISSFLNSSGGILIWGAPAASKAPGNDKDLFVGALCPLREFVGKDTVINRINAMISPLPAGLNVQILSNEDTYVYVFEVQESRIKPHQFEYRYYIRLDGQTHPAPHYMVDAMIKQVTYPDLAGVIAFHTFHEGKLTEKGTEFNVTIGLFNFSPFQNEETVSYRLTVSGGFFTRSRGALSSLSKNPWYGAGGYQVVHQNFADVLHFGAPKTYLEPITISPQMLKTTGDMLHLHLVFGGKYSPAKASNYTLDLSKYWYGLDARDLIVETEENVLFADKELKSRKDQLDEFKRQL